MKPIFSITDNELTKLPEKTTEKWKTLSDDDQYQYFRNAVISAKKLELEIKNIKENIISPQKELITESKKQIKINTKFINDMSFFPKFGISAGCGLRINKTLNTDFDIYLDFSYYFLRRFFLSSGVVLNPYKELGGGINLQFGILVF